jgi:predicted metal-dependent hydrolase
MKESIFISFTIILIFIFIFLNTDLDLELFTINNEKILVRNTPDKHLSARLLYNLIQNMYKLRHILIDNINNYPDYNIYIKMLESNFNRKRTKIYETALNSSYTSYCVNKGEEFAFCLRCKKEKKLHSLNLLTYVAVHEMAHAGCPENGHTQLFAKIFRFYLQVATKYNIYTYENYSSNPVDYCGLRLYTNILN